jgi:hypothetical protein
LEFCVHAADFAGKLVLVAGLDGDFRRQRFGQARGPRTRCGKLSVLSAASKCPSWTHLPATCWESSPRLCSGQWRIHGRCRVSRGVCWRADAFCART